MFYKPLFDYDLQGVLSGRVSLSDSVDPMFEIKLNIDQFKTIYGLLGQINIDANVKNNQITLSKISLSQIHNLNVRGIIDLNDKKLNLDAKGDVQLNAFQFFPASNFFGKFNVKGAFKGGLSNILYDGTF